MWRLVGLWKYIRKCWEIFRREYMAVGKISQIRFWYDKLCKERSLLLKILSLSFLSLLREKDVVLSNLLVYSSSTPTFLKSTFFSFFFSQWSAIGCLIKFGLSSLLFVNIYDLFLSIKNAMCIWALTIYRNTTWLPIGTHSLRETMDEGEEMGNSDWCKVDLSGSSFTRSFGSFTGLGGFGV